MRKHFLRRTQHRLSFLSFFQIFQTRQSLSFHSLSLHSLSFLHLSLEPNTMLKVHRSILRKQQREKAKLVISEKLAGKVNFFLVLLLSSFLIFGLQWHNDTMPCAPVILPHATIGVSCLFSSHRRRWLTTHVILVSRILSELAEKAVTTFLTRKIKTPNSNSWWIVWSELFYVD